MRTLALWAIAVGLVVVGLSGPIDREHEERQAYRKAVRDVERLEAIYAADRAKRRAETKAHFDALTPEQQCEWRRNVQATEARLLGIPAGATQHRCKEVS